MFALILRRSTMGFACVAALSAGSAAGATGLSVRELGALQMRVKAIGYRIAAANAGACARPEMMSGIVAHDLTQYLPEARQPVSQAFSLTDGFGVLQIVPGSTADRAGLRIDDEIIKVGDTIVEDPSAVRNASPSYAREDQFAQILSAELAKGPAQLTVRRAGQLVRVTLTGQAGCGGDVILSNSSNLNAWSDGRRVMVTTAMMQQTASDDELAFVVAHEMAHNILGHSDKNDSYSLLGILGIGSSRVKRMEMDADSYAVPLMSYAGFAPQGGMSFLAAARRRLWWNDMSIDHPSFGRRMKIVSAAIARLPQPSPSWFVQTQGGPQPAPKVIAYVEPREVCGSAVCAG
jgi:hypothetical protein